MRGISSVWAINKCRRFSARLQPYSTVEVLTTLQKSWIPKPDITGRQSRSFPRLGGSPRSIAITFCIVVWPPDGEIGLTEYTFTRLDRIHERERQTDKQTDTTRQRRPRLCKLCIVLRGKKNVTAMRGNNHNYGRMNLSPEFPIQFHYC